MAYYPIFVELRDRPCVVIGGGREAQRKVNGLLAANAKVTVIAPSLTRELQRFLAEGEIDCIQREYAEGDMEGFEICMVATDDGAVNAEVAAEGKRKGIWVNAADDPANCDFILPAVIRREVPEAEERLPSIVFGSAGGGVIAIDPMEQGGNKAFEKLFQFDIELMEPVDAVFIGGRVYVRFDHGHSPIASQIYRRIRQLFLRRFNV